jgi:hypothetical protein
VKFKATCLSSFIFKSLVSKTSSLEIRKKVIELEKTFSGDYQLLMKELFELIYSSNLKDNTKKALLCDLGEYMYRDNFVVDHEINFYVCVAAMENSINS